MMKVSILLTMLIMLPLMCGYSYPVAPLTDNVVAMMHQDDEGQLRLYGWDLSTNAITEPLLASYYNAALVKVLPSGDEFSFIDEESIFIKKLSRRSAKRIEIDEPLYGIELIEWLDDDRCYFHAMEGDRAGIYQLLRDGDIRRLKRSRTHDYLYPQIVDDHIFYIKRSLDNQHYVIAMSPYCSNSTSDDCVSETVISDCGNRPIVLLRMISASCGYCIEHPITHEQDTIIITLPVHILFHDGVRWRTEQFFSLRLPVELLFDDSKKLVESLAPFIPYYHHDRFYFSSCPTDSTILAIYCYDRVSHKIELVVRDAKHLLAPIIFNDFLIYGSTKELHLYRKPLA